MSSILCVSKNFDDTDEIIGDLLLPIQGKTFENALGILLCDSEIDYFTMVPKLQEQIDFPIIGGTTMAFPFFCNADEEVSASLVIISSPQVKFSFAASLPLDVSDHTRQVKELFNKCSALLGEPPKLIMPFFPHMPGMPTNIFVDDLFVNAKQIPVFGGMTTSNLVSTQAAVFLEGKVYNNSMLFLFIGGNIEPVFASGSKITLSASSHVVTQSEGNMVNRIEDKTLCDYMRGIGFSPEKRINGVDALMQHGPLPVLVEREDRVEDGMPEVRCISYVDMESGSAAFSGNIPVGSRISIGVLRDEDIKISAQKCLEDLRVKMAAHEQKGYSYSLLFCVSCVARYFVLSGSESFEQTLLTESKPEHITATGYYGFCEIGPTYSKVDGSVLNRSHSASIVFCAF